MQRLRLSNASIWGTLTVSWVPHDTLDQIVDFVRRWSEKAGLGAGRFIEWLDIAASQFYDRRERHGKVSAHNCWVPATFGWRIGRSRPSSAFANIGPFTAQESPLGGKL